MRSKVDLAIHVLKDGRRTLIDNLDGLRLEEALQAAGGYRSVLGILKHTASWSHVYRSYAFDSEPKHLNQTAWPRGLRDTIAPEQAYVDEIIAWFEESCARWQSSLAGTRDDQLDELRSLHWGEQAPLFDIVAMTGAHWAYHAGELNEILAIVRGEAWVYTEEVEENHISTAGHRLRAGWMSDEHAKAYEAHLANRDHELHGGARES